MAHAHVNSYSRSVRAERMKFANGEVEVAVICGDTRISMSIDEAAELAAQIATAMMPVEAETEAAEVPA